MTSPLALFLAAAAAAGEPRTIASPDGAKTVAYVEYAAFATLRTGGREIRISPRPYRDPRETPADYPFSLRRVQWSPDSRKLMLIGGYYTDHWLVAVYDLDKGAITYMGTGVNVLSWLPDSSSYLSDDTREGTTAVAATQPGKPNVQAITLYRNPLARRGRPEAWGRIIWNGPRGRQPMIYRIGSRDWGREIEVEVEGESGSISARVPSQGRHVID